MNYKVELLKHGDIKYTEDNKTFTIVRDFRDGEIYLSLKDVRRWGEPYDENEIPIKKRQEILKRIEEGFIERGWEKEVLYFDYTPESAIYYAEEVSSDLNNYYELFAMRGHISKVREEQSNQSLDIKVLKFIQNYYTMTTEEQNKFTEIVKKDKPGVLILLKDFAKRKIENPNQRDFTYGLYALDMLLNDNDNQEIKEILKDYIVVSKNYNLSFNEFMSKNRPLNNLIKELL